MAHWEKLIEAANQAGEAIQGKHGSADAVINAQKTLPRDALQSCRHVEAGPEAIEAQTEELRQPTNVKEL